MYSKYIPSDLLSTWPANLLLRKKIWFFDELVYIICLSLTRISIQLFYLTVFPKRTFRLCVKLIITLNFMFVIACTFVVIFQCRPVPGAWRAWDGEFKARCIDPNKFAWVNSAFNITFDVAALILPMPELFALTMSRRKKAQIIFMFGLGFL